MVFETIITNKKLQEITLSIAKFTLLTLLHEQNPTQTFEIYLIIPLRISAKFCYLVTMLLLDAKWFRHDQSLYKRLARLHIFKS